MAQSRDYYEILEVERTATTEEIKKAYRKKVRACHPDTHRDDPDAEQKYKEVNEAFAVLGNAEKRQHYDQFGTADDAGNPFGGDSPFGDMGDIFESFFGGGMGGFGGQPRADRPMRGSDLQMMLSVTLEEAATGVEKEVEIPRWEPCDHCEGTGSEPGHDPRECSTCHGTGQVRHRVRTVFGDTVSVGTCPSCNGRGKVIEHPCRECGGEGRIHRRRSRTIKVQSGVDTGTRLRVPGAGELGVNGGTPGDLYIIIEVKPHRDFSRDGIDLHKAISIPYPLAVLGGNSSTDTLIDGDADFEIKPGTAPGDTIRLKGMGMPRLRSNFRGDLYLHVTIDVPKAKDLSKREKELVRELAAEAGIASCLNEKDSSILEKLFGAKKKKNVEKKKKSK